MSKSKRIIIAVVLLLVAALSFTVIYNAFAADTFVRPRIQYLDDKKTTIMEMSAVAIAASAAITLVPGDVGTPIADKLADLSKYSVVILCAVFLEKYLLKLLVVASFRIIIPVGLLILALCFAFGRQRFIRLGARLVLCGVLIFSIIPVSVFISQTIETTYKDTIEDTIETAKEDTKEIEDNSESQSALERFINSIKGGVKTVTDKFEKTLTNMIEAFAVMIVTSCLIPIVVFLLFWWLLKSLFSEDTFRRGPTIPFLDKPGPGGARPALAGEGGYGAGGYGAGGNAAGGYGPGRAEHPGGGEPGRPFDEGFWDARADEPPAPIPVNAVVAEEGAGSADAGADRSGTGAGSLGAGAADGADAAGAEAQEADPDGEEPRGGSKNA